MNSVQIMTKPPNHTPLPEAVVQDCLDGKRGVALLFLSQGNNIHAVDTGGNTALHWAAISLPKSSIGLMNDLIELGASLEACNQHQETPLHWALNSFNCTEKMAFLIAHGVNVNAKDHQSSTLLIQAASRGLPQIVEMLIDHGAGVNVIDDLGRTPLIAALRVDMEAMALRLIAHGADSMSLQPTNTHYHAMPATHAAAQLGLTRRLMALLDAGADPSCLFGGRSIQGQAARNGHVETRAALQAWEAQRAIDSVLQIPSGTRP